MPDNVTVGLNTVAADELETVNGVTQVEPLPKAERVKIGHGPDGSFTDVSTASPLPVVDAAIAALQSAEHADLAALLTQLTTFTTADHADLVAVLADLGPLGTQTTLAGILAKLTADPATGARQDKLMTPTSAVSYGTGTANAVPVAPADAAGRLMGYAVREAAATPAAAVVRFRSGTTAAGTPLGSGVSLAPGESVREWFGPAGINVPTAVFLERVSGTTEVTVYWSAP